MKAFFIFIRKEFYHIFRDSRSLLILLGMPIVLVLLFGFAITNEIKEAKIAVVDDTRNKVSREMAQRLDASNYFEVVVYPENQSVMDEAFRQNQIKMAVIFRNDLSPAHDSQIHLIADASDPNTANTLINYATIIIRTFEQEHPAQAKPARIQTEVRMLYNPRLEGVYMFVPGVMTIILMLVSAMMTSIAITREKELGTMEVLLVSPIRPFGIILGKVIPYIVIALANTAVILLLGTLVFQMPVRGSLALLLGACGLFVITSLALGLLISTRTNSQQVAMLISLMALMLPTILLSGFIFPIESMPLLLQWISNIIPAKWFIIIVKNIMLKGTGLEAIWKESLILVGMTLFLFLASIRSFKIRLA
ncbi:MAG TPA: ABC transporter permease [Saprospiraceae bacterium]|nr:ABC transporter permease [Saprospiraceae bacterium]HMQ84193.1 ABC transporter permease [Saprospiraceae bacterium]